MSHRQCWCQVHVRAALLCSSLMEREVSVSEPLPTAGLKLAFCYIYINATGNHVMISVFQANAPKKGNTNNGECQFFVPCIQGVQ